MTEGGLAGLGCGRAPWIFCEEAPFTFGTPKGGEAGGTEAQ